MTEARLRYALALLQLPGMGAATVGKLLQSPSDLSLFFNREGQCLAPLQGEIDWALVDANLQWAQNPACAILTLDDPRYPSLLKEIHIPPPILFVKGDLNFLNRPQLAIVGSRNPTLAGRNLALEFAQYFSELGLTVTSGLALGIDAAAHQGGLRGQGGTVAVLGNGLADIYPKSNRRLGQEILEKGVIVSEFSIYEQPHATHFPRRNRIIAGLSRGTLVVEAALNSGSLITAQYAIEQGREVFAIPGSIHSPLAKGCHHLIKQGAKLVESAQDVLEELGSLFPTPGLVKRALAQPTAQHVPSPALEKGLAKLLSQVSYGLTTVNELVEASGLTVAAVSSMLLELELYGQVISVPGGYARVGSRR